MDMPLAPPTLPEKPETEECRIGPSAQLLLNGRNLLLSLIWEVKMGLASQLQRATKKVPKRTKDGLSKTF